MVGAGKILENSFDLTTEDGLRRVVSVLGSGVVPTALLAAYGLYYFAGKLMASRGSPVASEQARCAEDLIRTCAEQGAEEVEIEMDESAGISLKSTAKEFPMDFTVGTKGTVKVKVKFAGRPTS